MSVGTAFREDFMGPCGTIWVSATAEVALLIDIYVPEAQRKRGIGTLLLKALSDHNKIIVTSLDSTPYGKILIEKFGFVPDEKLKMYVFTK